MNRSRWWCPEGCGKKVMYNRDVRLYVCECCKNKFTWQTLVSMNSRYFDNRKRRKI